MELEKFTSHLQSLQTEDWNRLFDLLPEIEKADRYRETGEGETLTDGTTTLPFVMPSETVYRTLTCIYDLELCPEFDWAGWADGQRLLNDTQYNFTQLDSIDLCKLLTCIVRTDRFLEGYLANCFENGIILKIIKALQQRVINNNL